MTISAEKAMRQATIAARHYLNAAQLDLDALFGPGWARGNPEVVVAYMTACIASMQQTVSRK